MGGLGLLISNQARAAEPKFSITMVTAPRALETLQKNAVWSVTVLLGFNWGFSKFHWFGNNWVEPWYPLKVLTILHTVNLYVEEEEEEEGGLFVVFSRSAEALSTVWSLGTASCRPWRTAPPRNAPAPADMRRRPRGLQILGRCRVNWARRASTPWWPFLWCRRRSDRQSRASSTSPRTCEVATKPERLAFPIYGRSDLAMFVSVASVSESQKTKKSLILFVAVILFWPLTLLWALVPQISRRASSDQCQMRVTNSNQRAATRWLGCCLFNCAIPRTERKKKNE